LETVRKTKATTTPEIIEALTEEPIVEEAENPVETAPQQIININTSDFAAPLVPQKRVHDIVDEAPELFGHSPTAQQIEEFKQKETAWRAKLRSL
jgi:hypothetical protein